MRPSNISLGSTASVAAIAAWDILLVPSCRGKGNGEGPVIRDFPDRVMANMNIVNEKRGPSASYVVDDTCAIRSSVGWSR